MASCALPPAAVVCPIFSLGFAFRDISVAILKFVVPKLLHRASTNAVADDRRWKINKNTVNLYCIIEHARKFSFTNILLEGHLLNKFINKFCNITLLQHCWYLDSSGGRRESKNNLCVRACIFFAFSSFCPPRKSKYLVFTSGSTFCDKIDEISRIIAMENYAISNSISFEYYKYMSYLYLAFVSAVPSLFPATKAASISLDFHNTFAPYEWAPLFRSPPLPLFYHPPFHSQRRFHGKLSNFIIRVRKPP